MAKLYIFGIGGTGSRVLRSLTMMLAAGVKVGIDEIVPIIIDPDASNADLTRTVQLMNTYKSIRSNLTFPGSNPNQFFRPELNQLLSNYTLQILGTNDQSFREFIDLPSMSRENKAMMRMLFSEKNLESSMDVGFKGNPNIGSVVLNQIVGSEDFETFANSFSNGDKIFIISSIFGGTGASGFPLLLKTLLFGDSFSNFNDINNAEIGAVSILPYFMLKSDEESEIDSATFISKTKSALAYYEKNISGTGDKKLSALYYLADDLYNRYDNNEGGSGQRNDAHLIEFLAASAIVHFTLNPNTSGGTRHMEFGLKDIGGGTVTFSSFYDANRIQLFSPLTQFVLMSKCFTDKYSYYSSTELQANADNFTDFYNTLFARQLKQFAELYLSWLDEMKNNKRSLDLFSLNCGDKPFEIVTGVKPASVFSHLSNYDLVSGRINSAVKDCISKNKEDKLLEMYFRGTQRLVKEKFKI